MTQQGHMRTSVSWTYRYVNAAVAELSSSVAEYREKECLKERKTKGIFGKKTDNRVLRCSRKCYLHSGHHSACM